jgi:hypothetical protein
MVNAVNIVMEVQIVMITSPNNKGPAISDNLSRLFNGKLRPTNKGVLLV